MKKWYCYTEAQGSLSPASKVFKVAVGDCQRDQVKKALLDCYALDCGFYFRQWDQDTEFELISRQQGYHDVTGVCPFGFQVVYVNIHMLYKAIMNGDILDLDNDTSYYKALFRDLSKLSPVFFAAHSSFRKSAPALTEKEKNLSVRCGSEGMKAAFGFSLIFALFLLGAMLEGIEHLFY